MSAPLAATLPPCSRCQAEVDPDDLLCAVCGCVLNHHAPAALAPQAAIVRCDGCSAAVTYVAEVKAPRCAFCGSVMHVEVPEDPIQQAEAFVPFGIGSKAARDGLKHWLANGGFFRPADLADESALDSLKPIWWPAWQVEDASALVSWTADTDHGRRRADWAPAAGATALNFAGALLSASKGLTLKETATLTPRYRLGILEPAPTNGPIGAAVERFEAQRSAARREILGTLEEQAKRNVSERLVPGTRRRNVRVSLLLRQLNTQRLGLPAFVLAYRYRGKLYRAVVHGQDASCVLGEMPLSFWRMAGAALGVAAALALLAGLGLRVLS